METIQINLNALQDQLCKSFCTDIRIIPKSENLFRIETPFYFPDGDAYQIYLKVLESGGFRVTDLGHTFMHLSYENETELMRKGTRGNLLDQIKLETGLSEDDGEFYLESTAEDIHINVFKLGQAITKIYDLTFLNRARVESTFYEDLEERIYSLVDKEKITPNYVYSGMENADDYPIDYMIEGKKEPLFLFGIGNRDKARLTTIILERLIRYNAQFESLIVFNDFDTIPRNDAKRLMNVSGEMISSLDAKDDLNRKLLKRVLL